METRFKTASAIILLLALQGCYPEGPDYVDETDIVYTNYDPGFDFDDVHTFALPAQVIVVSDQDFHYRDHITEPDFVDPQYSSLIVSAVRNNMAATGCTEIDKNENPDVILLLSVSATTQVYFYYDWDYWSWWYPGWHSGRGWRYPGYYHPPYRRCHRVGTLFIQMVDARHESPDSSVPMVWSAMINGLLDGDAASFSRRVHNAIDQAFRQSPYLHQ